MSAFSLVNSDKRGPFSKPVSPLLPAFSPRNIIGDTGSTEALSLARSWMADCVTNHKTCNSFPLGYLPKRVLDISHSETTDDVRLLETSLTGRAKYACLSYSWGGTLPLQTTSKTLLRHKTSILLTELPLTFQDTIKFLRQTGIQYLWIDSLCIIQDNDNDWRREAAQMHSIFQGAFLTISASKNTRPD